MIPSRENYSREYLCWVLGPQFVVCLPYHNQELQQPYALLPAEVYLSSLLCPAPFPPGSEKGIIRILTSLRNSLHTFMSLKYVSLLSEDLIQYMDNIKRSCYLLCTKHFLYAR